MGGVSAGSMMIQPALARESFGGTSRFNVTEDTSAQGRRSDAGTIARVSAPQIEAVVVDALQAAYPGDAALDDRALTRSRIGRIVLRAGSIVMHPILDPASPIEIAWSPPPPRGRREILASEASEGHDRGIKAEARTVLLRSIALGRRWLDEVLGGATIEEIADRERCTKRHVAER
jgi:site-specific DNA recombinase